MSLLRRTLILAVLASGLLLGGAGPASAHPALVSSSPGAGYAVTDAPRELVLSFNEPVSLPSRPVTLQVAGGSPVEVRVVVDGPTVRATPTRTLAVGAYELAYRVVGSDGDLIAGQLAFGVATPVGAVGAAAAGGSGAQGVQTGTTLLRALLFLGLALGLGGGYLAWRVDSATGGLSGVRPLLRSGSLLALAGALGLLAAVGGPSRLLETAGSPGIGRLLAAQVVLLILAAAVAGRGRARAVVATLPLLVVVALEGARAHPSEVDGFGGALLTMTHLVAGALWLGGLVHVLRLVAAWRDRPKAMRVAVRVYGRSAVVLVVLVAVTGTVSALVLLPSAQDWTGTAYGRLLLVKISVFALGLLAAALARARLQRRTAAAAPPTRLLGRAAGVEAALLAAVVLAAATITSLTPARLVPASSLLAAPVGPTVRVAERVHQVSVSAVASQGRVELRADAPDDGRPLRIDLTAQQRTPAGRTVRLALTSCGPACWTGPVDWATGGNDLLLQVDAGRWQAGGTSLPVTWPVTPAPGLLARVQTAMGARTSIDTVETVTSGFGVVLPSRSRRTGKDFLSAQPWNDGGATDAVLVGGGGRRALLFALPALGYHFTMVLDASDRIVSERIVTPNHLLTRQYSYP